MCVGAVMFVACVSGVWAQQSAAPGPTASPAAQPQKTVDEWLERLQSAPRRNSYAGTVEVSIGGHVSSSRIEHTLVGGQTVARIETQGNRPRIAYRHADEVLTLWPASRQAVREKRDPLMSFPNLLQGPASRLSQVYRVGVAGADAVAGHASKRIDLMPRDDWRFGYRLWSEARTGLPVKMQIVDARGQVLEQSAFSELRLSPALDVDALERQRRDLEGYTVKTSSLQRTTADQEGWRLSRDVPGFMPVSCYRRELGHGDSAGAPVAMQWIFSDGLGSVSLFLQPYDSAQHLREVQLVQGATHVLTRRVQDWWLTAVGEVPAQTLQAFADALERKP